MEENYNVLNIQIDKSVELLLQNFEKAKFKDWGPYNELKSKVSELTRTNSVIIIDWLGFGGLIRIQSIWRGFFVYKGWIQKE